MARKKLATNGKPATKRDLELLSGEITLRSNGIEGRLDRMEKNMATKSSVSRLEARLERVDGTLESILKVLQSIEGRLKERANHEERITRIEKAVFFKR